MAIRSERELKLSPFGAHEFKLGCLGRGCVSINRFEDDLGFSCQETGS